MSVPCPIEDPRFVLLWHEMPQNTGRASHFDLMLQRDGELLTWELAHIPDENESLMAQQLPPHRLSYLDYEGPVSRNRGTVERRFDGIYKTQRSKPGHLLSVTLFREQVTWMHLQLEKREGQCWCITRGPDPAN